VQEIAGKMKALEGCELFGGLDFSARVYMASIAHLKEYAARDVIFVADDSIREVLVLAEGRVKLSQFTEAGAEVILRLCSKGEELYPLAMAQESTYLSTAQALEDCNVLAWDASAFETALGRFPALRRNVLHVLSHRIQQLGRRFCNVCTGNISPRLARGMIQLIDQIGRQVNGHVEIHLSQESLAQMTAMTPSSVSRVLRKWEMLGLVTVRRGTIEVHSVFGLSDMLRAK